MLVETVAVYCCRCCIIWQQNAYFYMNGYSKVTVHSDHFCLLQAISQVVSLYYSRYFFYRLRFVTASEGIGDACFLWCNYTVSVFMISFSAGLLMAFIAQVTASKQPQNWVPIRFQVAYQLPLRRIGLFLELSLTDFQILQACLVTFYHSILL